MNIKKQALIIFITASISGIGGWLLHDHSVRNELEFAEKYKDLSECEKVIDE